jgi:transposase
MLILQRRYCRRCDPVVTEQVPWARPRARHTRDFEDVVGWLAQACDRTTIRRLMRCSCQAVAGIVVRVVDEVSYGKGHRYLTVVADHDQGGRPPLAISCRRYAEPGMLGELRPSCLRWTPLRGARVVHTRSR